MKARIEQLEQQRKKLAAVIPTTMVMKERAAMRPDRVLIRGDFLRPGEPVEPDVPSFLPPLRSTAHPATRLDLARWLVRRDHPLTARVAVNRIWMHLMGRGLVETENDFGYQGTPPTHPELLDYLAVEFMRRNWSVKSIIREIVCSATYRQSSVMRPRVAERDPDNRWYARQSRWRVEAEIVRDVALAVSGLWQRDIGGPSVYPPQPQGVYAFTQRKAKWPTSRGAARYRRGIYTFFMRSAPYPMLSTFDVPRMNTACTRRSVSNTPLQALALANSEAIVECAKHFGMHLARRRGTDRQRIETAWLRALGRPPTPREASLVLAYLARQRDDYRRRPNHARLLVRWSRHATGRASRGEADDTPELAEQAAWILVARLLLNLDEFVTRE